jgi:formate dehydrogenase subunit delta
MRDALKTYMDQGGDGLSPLCREAMNEYFKGPKTPVKPAAAAKAAN